jgi:uncharacterized membrane protein
MESTVEQRLTFLEARVKTLEGLLEVASVPTPAPLPVPPAPPRRMERRAPVAPSEPRGDLEEILGGRVLGWVGGVAVVIAAALFVVMAVHNGWIGEAARMELAFAGSAALVVLGIWLYERRGQTQAALATVASGIAALYACTAATTLHYHLISPTLGLVIAGAIGALALVTAVRWDSQEIAGLGIVGSLLAPVFVDCGTSTSALVFMTIALVVAIAVVVARGWAWLALIAYAVSLPQLIAWLNTEYDPHLGLSLAVVGAFALLYVAAAIGHELRAPTEALRLSSASLLLLNASVTSALGLWVLYDSGHHRGSHAWVFGVAVAHLVLGTLVLRSRASREIALLFYGVGVAVLGVAFALALNGPALVAAWSTEAVVLALVGRRTSTPGRALVAALVFAGLAGAHALVFEAPPTSLAWGFDSIPDAVGAIALVLVALGAIVVAYGEEVREELCWIGAGLGVYLASGLVVDLAGAQLHHSTQTSQLALSGFWAALGFAALVAGLLLRRRALRLTGFAVLALAVGKLFLVDLAHLESIWRVGSFLAVGLLLLAGAFAYQRTAHRPRRPISSEPT